jgi:hypothetical protein
MAHALNTEYAQHGARLLCNVTTGSSITLFVAFPGSIPTFRPEKRPRKMTTSQEIKSRV